MQHIFIHYAYIYLPYTCLVSCDRQVTGDGVNLPHLYLLSVAVVGESSHSFCRFASSNLTHSIDILKRGVL